MLNRILMLTLLASAPLVRADELNLADDSLASPPALSIARNGEELMSIVIHDEDGSPAVTIRPDGTVETTKEPKEAARLFWNAIAGYLHQCSKHTATSAGSQP